MTRSEIARRAGVDPLLKAVKSLTRTSEADFLRAGTSLESALNRFERLEAAASQVAGLSDRVDEVAQAAMELDGNMRGAIDEVANGLGPITELSTIGARLGECLAVMSQRVRTIRVVSINARVVIATMTSGASGLASFADDIRDVGSEIEAVLSRVDTALTDLRSSAEIVSTGGRRLTSVLGDKMARSLANLTDELVHYERGLGDLTRSGGGLAERSVRLRQAVTNAVMALQAGDALRQRLEHCAVIIETAQNPFSEPGPERLLLLTRFQLDDLAVRHRDEVGKAADALADAGAEAHHFLAEIGMLVPSPDGPGTALQAAVRTICDHLEECREATDALHTGAAAMTERMHEMLASMSDFAALGERIRYIALNAVIACVGLGSEGAPLTAISRQLRELAEECIERQNQMNALIDGIESTWTDMRGRLSLAAGTLQGDVARSAEGIEASLADLQSRLDAQGREIARARAGLDEDVAYGSDALQAQLASVEEVAAMALRLTPERVAPSPLSPAGAATSARLRALLTIEQERRVHDEWQRTITGEAPPAPNAAPAPSSIDDILFA
ncbi:hypothetical protein L1787_05965 [Acuticoccus sp. M5D2P5]|uniref:hypothetical protein n=1 Tax=Acuticoccus kalidii TaxID=2910977 RepID=UPI001F3E6F81|nr:hypothetical protein [Acuticoccus kalidii]MCF3932960.1 hypothetical protein [Acuticoccus kalidii]